MGDDEARLFAEEMMHSARLFAAAVERGLIRQSREYRMRSHDLIEASLHLCETSRRLCAESDALRNAQAPGVSSAPCSSASTTSSS